MEAPAKNHFSPVTVEELWAEKADLGVYIEEMVAQRAGQAVVSKLAEIDALIERRIADMESERLRQRRIRKKRMLLLNG